jgi:hypothetical protein
MARPRDPAAIARYITAQAGMASPRIPPIAELEALARAYTEMVDRSTAPTRDPLYVTLAAAREFAAHVGAGADIETARRQLAELLVHARPSTSDPTLYRARRRSSGLDVSARVIPQGGLLVVTTISVRDL